MSWFRRFVLRLRNRKDLSELTLDDFLRCAAWEQAFDEEGRWFQDECTVRPRPDLKRIGDGEWVMVLTEYEAADGTRYQGFCHVGSAREAGADDLWPIWCMDHTLCLGELWLSLRVSPHSPFEEDSLAFKYRQLGKTADRLFPLRFQMALPVAGEAASGTLAGYISSPDWRKAHYVT